MKTTCLLFLTISWTASMNAASGHPRDAERAAPADHGTAQTARKASDERRDHSRASGRNHSPSRVSLTKAMANRPKQLPDSQSIAGPAINLQQPGTGKSAGAPNGGVIQSVTVNTAQRLRAVSAVRSTVPSLNSVRHRGANPAVVGGLAPLHRANTGAINGTRMNRKP